MALPENHYFIEKLLTIDDADELFQSLKEIRDIDPSYLLKIIEYAMSIRPLKLRPLFALYNKVKDDSNFQIDDVYNKNLRGLITTKKAETSESIYNLFNDQTAPEYHIIKDDVATLTKDFAGFNANDKIRIENSDSLRFVENDFEAVSEKSNNFQTYTYAQLMTYYGAIECFKQSMSSLQLDKLKKYAIAGGSKDMIDLFKNNGCDFNDCLTTAIKYHRNEYIKEMVSHANQNDLWEAINDSIKFFNDFAFEECFNAYTNKSNLNELFIQLSRYYLDHEYLPVFECFLKHVQLIYILWDNCHGISFIHLAAQNNCVVTLDYIISLKIIKHNELEDCVGRTCLHFAAAFGNLEAVKYLVERAGMDPNQKDGDEKTPLHYAAIGGHLNTAKYLVENCNVDPEQKDRVFSPIEWALNQSKIELFKYFVGQED